MQLNQQGPVPSQDEPAGRFGSFCFFYKKKFYVSGGRRNVSHSSKWQGNSDHDLLVFDLVTCEWMTERTRGIKYPALSASGTCCEVINDSLYALGSENFITELHIPSLLWKELPVNNKEDAPLRQVRSGMVACGEHMLCVFGGFGYLMPGMRRQCGASYHKYSPDPYDYRHWTNELHLFELETCKFLCMITKLDFDNQ